MPQNDEGHWFKRDTREGFMIFGLISAIIVYLVFAATVASIIGMSYGPPGFFLGIVAAALPVPIFCFWVAGSGSISLGIRSLWE